MINLNKISTKAPQKLKKKEVKKMSERITKEIGLLQHVLYAEKKQSILIVLQGLDASGKDGATKFVFQNCGTIGLDAFGFKKPTDEEFSHDFLWRVHKLTPAKGFIQIFNRSHYEDILIQRVHNWIDMKRVKNRMDAINSMEKNLEVDNNTKVLKFYLHISKEKQREKLQERIDNPAKNWKHNSNDWEETKLWDQYRVAYEFAINQSTIPWHIIPVDNRWYRNYLISKIVLDALKAMNPQLPLLADADKQAVLKLQTGLK